MVDFLIVAIDALMIWYNFKLYKRDIKNNWRYIWGALLIFWISCLPFDLIDLFGGR